MLSAPVVIDHKKEDRQKRELLGTLLMEFITESEKTVIRELLETDDCSVRIACLRRALRGLFHSLGERSLSTEDLDRDILLAVKRLQRKCCELFMPDVGKNPGGYCIGLTKNGSIAVRWMELEMNRLISECIEAKNIYKTTNGQLCFDWSTKHHLLEM